MNHASHSSVFANCLSDIAVGQQLATWVGAPAFLIMCYRFRLPFRARNELALWAARKAVILQDARFAMPDLPNPRYRYMNHKVTLREQGQTECRATV